MAAGLLAAASVGLQILVPLVFPQLDRTLGKALISLCVVGLILALLLLYSSQKRGFGLQRHWSLIGSGQGWVESRVRNNAGDQLTVTSNPGGGADQISISVIFRKRRKARQSETIEIVFDVDGKLFEWDAPDTGEAEIVLDGRLWREVEVMKAMLEAMRHGKHLKVLVPALSISAWFTLSGSFDVLRDAATLGDVAKMASQ